MPLCLFQRGADLCRLTGDQGPRGWIGLADAHFGEIPAEAGFDWLPIEVEHAPRDIRSLSVQFAVVLVANFHLSGLLSRGLQRVLRPRCRSALALPRLAS